MKIYAITTSMMLVTACSDGTGFTSSGPTGHEVNAVPTEVPVLEGHNVVGSTTTQLSFDTSGGHLTQLPTALNLVTVPSMTSVTVTSFLNATAGSSLQYETFGYFDAVVKNNSSALNGKTDIYLTVRFALAASQFEDAGSDVLVTSIVKPAIGTEASTTNLIPTSAVAGSGVRAFSFCNAASGNPCAAKPVIDAFPADMEIIGNFAVPAGAYSGTLTWELTTN